MPARRDVVEASAALDRLELFGGQERAQFLENGLSPPAEYGGAGDAAARRHVLDAKRQSENGEPFDGYLFGGRRKMRSPYGRGAQAAS